MVEEYNKNFLSDQLDYNDPLVADLADNLFEKIRKDGILASYIERDKDVRIKNNLIDISTTPGNNVDEELLSFGSGFDGEKLGVKNSVHINIGKVYNFEFEFVFRTAVLSSQYVMTFMDDAVSITEDSINFYNLTVPNLTFVIDKLYKVKVSRVNDLLSLYLDGVLIGEDTISNDVDTVFTNLYWKEENS